MNTITQFESQMRNMVSRVDKSTNARLVVPLSCFSREADWTWNCHCVNWCHFQNDYDIVIKTTRPPDMRPDGPRDTVAGSDSGPSPPLPLRLNGKVIKGFGRGSSEVRRVDFPCPRFQTLLPPSTPHDTLPHRYGRHAGGMYDAKLAVRCKGARMWIGLSVAVS